MMSHLLAVLAATTVGHSTPAKHTLAEVNFAFDKSEVIGEDSVRLMHAASYASAHPNERLVLDAYCDPIGTGPYNVALSIQRAEAVRDQLAGMGVPRDQIVVAAFGKDGERRASYAADRRVTVWTTGETLASVIDRTFEGHGTAVAWDRPLTGAQINGVIGDAIASR